MTAQPLPRPAGDPRSSSRTRLFLSATIRFGGESGAIRLRDLSPSGARIEGARLPGVGAVAHIARGTLAASGTIVWRDRKGCGVRFDAPLPLGEWMPALGQDGQQAVDELVEAVRTGTGVVTPIRPPCPLDLLRDALPRRLAEELAYVARLLESLGDDLCNEPLVMARHGAKLQDLDIGAQILGHVGALLVADDAARAVDGIGMDALRKRLLRPGL